MYLKTEREELKALAKKTEFFSNLEMLTPKEQIELIEKLTIERDRYKRINRIHELEDCPLPARAVVKRLEDFGYKIEEFYDESGKDEDDGFTIPDNLQHVYWTNDITEELSDTDKIEIKLIPAEEYSPDSKYTLN